MSATACAREINGNYLSRVILHLVPSIAFAKGRSSGHNAGRSRREAPQGRSDAAPQRGPAGSPNAPTPPPSFKNLSPRQRAGVAGLAAVALIALLGGVMLFVNNVNVVRADAAYKQGQAYEQVGSQCLQQPQACPVAGAQQLTPQQVIAYTGTSILPQAITDYQQAVDTQPNQDRYDLDLGKAHIDEAQYYVIASRNQGVAQQAHLSAINAQSDAVGEFQAAEAAFRRARSLNPYNADHPMNLARLYTIWAELIAPRKWALADAYYRLATGPALAPHNGRFADEWGHADLIQAQQPGLTPARRNAIYRQALHAFQHACAVDDLLGDARVYRGDTEEQLSALPQNAAQKRALMTKARDSYVEALAIGGFEQFSAQAALQRLIQADVALHDYSALVRPIHVPVGGTVIAETPIALADALLPGAGSAHPPVYAATSPYSLTTTAFSPTLHAISQTLRAKGLVKQAP